MAQYAVALWKWQKSPWPEWFDTIEADSAEQAVQVFMRAHNAREMYWASARCGSVIEYWWYPSWIGREWTFSQYVCDVFLWLHVSSETKGV